METYTLVEASGQIDHGDIGHRDTERHPSQLAATHTAVDTLHTLTADSGSPVRSRGRGMNFYTRSRDELLDEVGG